MSRIYVVRNKETGTVARYVRANNLNAAVRAVANELFTADHTTTDQVYQAMLAGKFIVLDAVAADAE